MSVGISSVKKNESVNELIVSMGGNNNLNQPTNNNGRLVSQANHSFVNSQSFNLNLSASIEESTFVNNIMDQSQKSSTIQN